MNRQILLCETCSISIVVGIRSPTLHSVACLCSRGSQVAIEFGLGSEFGIGLEFGPASPASAVMPGAINFNDAHIKCASLPVQGPVSESRWDVGGVGLKLRPCSAPVGGCER